MNIVFSEEGVSDLRHDSKIKELSEAHHKEIPIMKTDLDLDYDKYYLIEKLDKLRIYTVRLEDTYELAGYSIFVLNEHILFKSKVTASQNALYIDPKYRGMHIGRGLLEYSERCLIEDEVDAIMQHVPEVNNFSGLVESLGYNKLETVYIKELTNGGY